MSIITPANGSGDGLIEALYDGSVQQIASLDCMAETTGVGATAPVVCDDENPFSGGMSELRADAALLGRVDASTTIDELVLEQIRTTLQMFHEGDSSEMTFAELVEATDDGGFDFHHLFYGDDVTNFTWVSFNADGAEFGMVFEDHTITPFAIVRDGELFGCPR